MFSAFTSFSVPVPSFLKSTSGAITLAPVTVHDVESQPEKRARKLKHLLRLNHATHSVLYHNLQYHNHLSHILGSAYILGGGENHLEKVYEVEADELDKWEDSPGEVSKHDWEDYLGDARYQRAYLDFFEDELVLNGYDWKKVLNQYLLSGPKPLISGLIAGLGHPLIHLGYAFELSNRELALEALTMAASCYNYLHKYTDDSKYTRPSAYSSTSPLEILQKVSEDKRFDKIFDHAGRGSLESLFKNHEDLVLEYWNAWQISEPKAQFEESQKTAVSLLTATQKSSDSGYDFFLVHLLTSSHAARIILPNLPAQFHVPLARQWWLFALAVYVCQLRPAVDLDRIKDTKLNGRDWKWVTGQAIDENNSHSTDAHYVKGIRAMHEAANTWGDADSFYLKAAVRFAGGFSGWKFESAVDHEAKN